MQWTDSYQESVFSVLRTTSTPTAAAPTSPASSSARHADCLNNYIKPGDGCSRKVRATLSGDDFPRRALDRDHLAVRSPSRNSKGKRRTSSGNREAQGLVESVVNEMLWASTSKRTPTQAKGIVQKAISAQRGARSSAQGPRPRTSQVRALASGAMPGKLADCQSKDFEESEIFLVEGDSAGGSAKEGPEPSLIKRSCRLKGKILNVEKARLDKMLGHSEIHDRSSRRSVAGIAEEFDLEKLRYGKTIIMTDADVDGSHIRTLLLTFFFRHMRPLIEEPAASSSRNRRSVQGQGGQEGAALHRSRNPELRQRAGGERSSRASTFSMQTRADGDCQDGARRSGVEVRRAPRSLADELRQAWRTWRS